MVGNAYESLHGALKRGVAINLGIFIVFLGCVYCFFLDFCLFFALDPQKMIKNWFGYNL